MRLRLVILAVVGVYGVVFGIVHHLRRPAVVPVREKSSGPLRFRSYDGPEHPTEARGLRIPKYDKGVLSSICYADKVVYRKGHPVELTKPVIASYLIGVNGKLYLSSIALAERGSVRAHRTGTAEQATYWIDNMEMYGKTKIHRYADPNVPTTPSKVKLK